MRAVLTVVFSTLVIVSQGANAQTLPWRLEPASPKCKGEIKVGLAPCRTMTAIVYPPAPNQSPNTLLAVTADGGLSLIQFHVNQGRRFAISPTVPRYTNVKTMRGIVAVNQWLAAVGTDDRLRSIRVSDLNYYNNCSRWHTNDHAMGGVGLALWGGHYYLATSKHQLWTRPVTTKKSGWRRLGHAQQVTAMTAHDGWIYATNSNNDLWIRRALPIRQPWIKIGSVPRIPMGAQENAGYANYRKYRATPVAMTVMNGRLYVVTHISKVFNSAELLSVPLHKHVRAIFKGNAKFRLGSAVCAAPGSVEVRRFVAECWECPPGYERHRLNLSKVTAANACVR